MKDYEPPLDVSPWMLPFMAVALVIGIVVALLAAVVVVPLKLLKAK